MANLTFKGVLPTGSRELGYAKAPDGAGVFDVFFNNIDLPGFVDAPALLILAVKRATHEKNFITVNAPEGVIEQSFAEAKEMPYFVWRVLPNPSDTWILQMHPIKSGILTAAGNTLGFHSRNDEGAVARVRDDFAVARLFIVYHSSE